MKQNGQGIKVPVITSFNFDIVSPQQRHAQASRLHRKMLHNLRVHGERATEAPERD